MADPTITYTAGRAEDADELLKMLCAHFFTTNPLAAAVGMSYEEGITQLPPFIAAHLCHPLTVIARNAAGEIVALQFTSIRSRDDEKVHEEVTDSTPESFVQVIRILSHMEEPLWTLLPSDVNRVMFIELTFVHPTYARRGIARHMSAMRLDKAKAMGCQGIVTDSTNFITQNLRLSEGHQILKEVQLADWKDKEGNVIFRPTDGTTRVVLFFRSL